jgi:hypothetical protein
MRRPILNHLFGLLGWLAASTAAAGTLELQARRLSAAGATMENIRIALDWPATATAGQLRVQAARVQVPALGADLRQVDWHCQLRRLPEGGWGCAGALRVAGAAPAQLLIRLGEVTTTAELQQGQTRLRLTQSATRPDRLEAVLSQVPLAWLQGLLAQGWPQARLTAGRLTGSVQADMPATGDMQVGGALDVRDAGLESGDASVVAQGVQGHLQLDYRASRANTRVALQGRLEGGEWLVGSTYVALGGTPVTLRVRAQQPAAAGWRLDELTWQDGTALHVSGMAELAPDGRLQRLALTARSETLAPLPARYLSAWLGLAGLSGIGLDGGLELALTVQEGVLQSVDARLHAVNVQDPSGRFVFDRLQGDLRYSAAAPVNSALAWQGGQLYGLRFGPARTAWISAGGELRTREPVTVPLMGGQMTLTNVRIRPPRAGQGLDVRFGLGLADVDVGQVAQALDLPPFKGRLNGDLPQAHYAGNRIDFEGGLQLGVFDGRVAVSGLALERPFGPAPSLSADIAMDDLDLLRLTEVLGFGSITGRLDGRITGLRLVDWTPVAFDARLITDEKPGVPRRISQRAVQDISSVGGASLVQTLQGRLLRLFDDFGYRRIGIGCKLEHQICTTSGLRSEGNAFTIVEGQGLPRLDVVGHNRAVDWETLVDRLRAATRGDTAPVIH